MPTIPQRELRNNISDVLRRVEDGECFTVTVSGRAVAELRPIRKDRPFASAEDLREIFKNAPVDPSWADDLRKMRQEDREAARDPWAE